MFQIYIEQVYTNKNILINLYLLNQYMHTYTKTYGYTWTTQTLRMSFNSIYKLKYCLAFVFGNALGDFLDMKGCKKMKTEQG